jgi:predicted O-linked N-acetylglucosamine transferase (SPINDLY family)
MSSQGRLDANETNALVNLFGQQRYAEAETLARAMTARFPGDGFAWKVLGAALSLLGRKTEALGPLQNAAALLPGEAGIHNSLGNIFKDLGRLEEAEASCRRALAIDPRFAAAHANLADILAERGRPADAEANYRRALAINPELAGTHNNLGNALKDLGRLEEAQAHYRRALTINPELAGTHNNLGNILTEYGRLAEAEASYRRALEIHPDFASAHSNLGSALKELGRLEQAEAHCRKALEIEPDFAQACNNLGNTLKELGRLEQAERWYRRALEINPEFAEAHSNLLFSLNYVRCHRSRNLEEARKFGHMATRKAAGRFCAWRCAQAQPDRLRVGIVSGDLRAHPVCFFLESVLAHLDPARIELIAYPTGYRADEQTDRVRPYFYAWKSLAGLADPAAARLIHADGVQVLLDLAGHTAKNRLPVFAWKPAPVQASWLGCQATTGVEQIDYLLGDPLATPAGEAWQFSETVWRLPEIFCCFTPPRHPLEVGPLPALSSGRLTFGCFNNLTKMNADVVRLWARVLRAIPGSRLFLKAHQLGGESLREATRERFADQGISPDRLLLEGGSPREAYLEAYNRVDIALDPFPYPGVTTSAEGLWMGVPVLTMRGACYTSHAGESLVAGLGLKEWCAADAADYLAKAVAQAANLERLAGLRGGLRRRLLASPLCDAPRFARHLETALLGMWERRQP